MKITLLHISFFVLEICCWFKCKRVIFMQYYAKCLAINTVIWIQARNLIHFEEKNKKHKKTKEIKKNKRITVEWWKTQNSSTRI